MHLSKQKQCVKINIIRQLFINYPFLNNKLVYVLFIKFLIMRMSI